MPFATWWRGDPLPALSPLPDFFAQPSSDVHLIAQLTDQIPGTIVDRLRADNHAYIAWLNGEPVAYGWVAKERGGISGLRFSFAVPGGTGYLWDFRTLTEWRGRGVYPHLLQSIIEQEVGIDYFWIGYEPGNEASARGISKAGFRLVCDLVVTDESRVVGLTLFEESERAQAIARMFNLPVVR